MRDDIQWFGKSPDNLPGIQEMVEGSSPDAYLENLEKAGFDTAVERYREEEARRSAIDKTGYPPLVDEQREVWRSWYERTTTLKEYGGSIPSEIAVELARISHEEVFSSLSLWEASDGEVLVVGTAKAGNAEQEYLLGQWTVDGSSTTEYSKLLYHFNKKQQRSKLRRMAVPVCGAILMVIALILALTDQTTLAASFLAWACILWVFSVARDDI